MCCGEMRLTKIVQHLCSKAGNAGSAYRHHEIGKVLDEELRDLMRPEEREGITSEFVCHFKTKVNH